MPVTIVVVGGELNKDGSINGDEMAYRQISSWKPALA